MTTATLYDRTAMTSATSGTGTLTLGAALGTVAPFTCSWQSFSAVGVPNAALVSYLILDSNGNWEYGHGTYTSSGTTLARTTILGSSNSGAAINCSGNEQIFLTALAEDLVTAVSNSDSTLTISPTTGVVVASLNLAHANTWTAQQTFSNSSSSGAIAVSSTTDSISTTTGSLVCAGGLGVAKNLYVGDNINLLAATSSSVGNLNTGGYNLFSPGRSNFFWGGGNYTLTGTSNISIGASLTGLTTGSGNVFFYGAGAGNSLTTGSYNLAIGYNACTDVSSGDTGNVGIGAAACSAINGANNNTGIGNSAGSGITTGSNNIAIGYSPLPGTTTASDCICIGKFSGNQGISANYNIGIGPETFFNNTVSGAANIAIGFAAGESVSSGTQNTFLGYESGLSVTTGSYNTIVGGGYFGSAALSNAVWLGDGNGNVRFDYGVTTASVNTITGNAAITGGLVVGAPMGGNQGTGTINVSSGIYLNGTAYTNPDFVFEHFFTGKIEKFARKPRAKDYPGLMALDTLQVHIRENLRLPRISDERTDIFERSDIALEKIEEAHLYIMQLHERLRALEAQVQKLSINNASEGK